MKLEELYRKSLSKWPEEIDISDGKFGSGDTFISPNLSKIWDSAEEGVGHEKGWDGLGVWVFYQCLHKQAKNVFGHSKKVSTNKISVELFDYYMRENLGDVSWAKERADYIAANGGTIKEHLV